MTQPSEPERTVTVPFREYMSLYKDSCTLEELRSKGVDNWEGWDEIDHDWIQDTCRDERNRRIHGEAQQ
jgi:hypothetical protein